jgi:voltage-gated potassium channel Kch
VVDIFILPVLGAGTGSTIVNLVYSALLFTGLAAVASRGVALGVIGFLVALAVALRWIAPVPGLPGTQAAAAASGLVVFATFTLLVLFRTLSPGPITRRRIEGAVAAYLLIAMSFAFAFLLIEQIRPGSLDLGKPGPETADQLVGYFSLVTLTTVGYGDVTPVTPLARRLAMLEGLIGQLYPAIVIGWMVGSMRRRED